MEENNITKVVKGSILIETTTKGLKKLYKVTSVSLHRKTFFAKDMHALSEYEFTFHNSKNATIHIVKCIWDTKELENTNRSVFYFQESQPDAIYARAALYTTKKRQITNKKSYLSAIFALDESHPQHPIETTKKSETKDAIFHKSFKNKQGAYIENIKVGMILKELTYTGALKDHIIISVNSKTDSFICKDRDQPNNEAEIYVLIKGSEIGEDVKIWKSHWTEKAKHNPYRSRFFFQELEQSTNFNYKDEAGLNSLLNR